MGNNYESMVFFINLVLVPPRFPSNSMAHDDAKIAALYIKHLFAGHLYPCPPSHPDLENFISCTLDKTRLHHSVLFASLILLQRLKACYPSYGVNRHRIFISAFIISSKFMCDDKHSNKTWSKVTLPVFDLSEINQMEREICNYLDWNLTISNPMLSNFMTAVKRDFCEDKQSYPYPDSFVEKAARVTVEATSNSAEFFQEQLSTSSPALGQLTSIPPLLAVDPRIRGVDQSPVFGIIERFDNTHPLKTKMFAFVMPSGW